VKKNVTCIVIGMFVLVGLASSLRAQERVFTLEELAQYNGRNGQPAYVAVDGVVYDMTNVPEWAGGIHARKYLAGQDGTQILATLAPHGKELLQGIPVVGKLSGAAPTTSTKLQRYRPILIGLGGNLNAILATVAASVFILRRINKHRFENKNVTIKNILKPLTKIHPYVGMTLTVTAFMHGMLALGTMFRLHTGPLIWSILVVMLLLATVGKKYKFTPWLKIHRGLALLLILTIITHITTAA
jgi:predicted heme/steroid binding protein